MTEKPNTNPENAADKESATSTDGHIELPHIDPVPSPEFSSPTSLSDIKGDVERAYEQVEVIPGTTIEARVPAVDSSTLEKVVDPLVSREWTLITAVIKRKLGNPSVRSRLKSFIGQPVSQHLASDMLHAAQSDTEVASMLARSGTHLTDMLALDMVPEETMNSDIKNASQLSHPLIDVQRLRRQGIDDDKIRRFLETRSKSGAYTNALSREEAPLVLKKYAFARDVKLLALGAELSEVGDVNLDANGEATLPSGVCLKVANEYSQDSKAFLDPSKWDYRRQFKDRVYEIRVDGKKYFLKERKTRRHKDTHEGEYREGLTSMEEFDVAVDLNAHATVSEGPIRISWEKPVGAVEYPDGFSFTVFEFEEGLREFAPVEEAASIIENDKATFAEEHQLVQERMQQYLTHPLVRKAADGESIKLPKRRFPMFRRSLLPLDYSIFAETKAQYLCDAADTAIKEKLIDAGYVIADSAPAEAYRLLRGESLVVEKVGFDYEQYIHNSARAKEIRQGAEESRNLYPGLEIPAQLESKPLHLAAYLALLERDGRPLSAELFKK